MSHSSDSNDSPDEAIPLLTDVLVTGSPTRSHHVPAPAAPADTFEDVPVLEDVFEAPSPKAPLDTPAPEAVDAPADAAPPAPIGHERVAEPPAAVEPVRHVPPAHEEPVHAAPVALPEAVAAPFTMAAAASAAPAQPVASTEAPRAATPNADALAEHLRGKFTAYLRGPGQEVIEERCRAAMQVHATWLVGQIAKEVGAVLEAQMSNWVREAVEEERRRQS